MQRSIALLSLTLALASTSVVVAQAPPPAGFPGVAPPSPPAIIRELSAEPAAIQQPGGSVVLRWEALNAYSVTLEPGVGAVSTRGTQRVSPSATTTYTLTAIGPEGPIRRTVTVEVAGTAPASAAASAARSSTIPRLANGKPDLSGLWQAERNVRLVGEVKLAAGAESFRVVEATERDAGTGADCLPPGVPAATMLPFPFQIVQTPEVIAIMYEAYHQFRIAPIGREHADYLAPAWMGHSVARWDGDTLVVDVRGFNDRTIVAGHRHTENLRVVEHYTRTAYDTMQYDAYVSDTVFAEVVHYSGTLTLHPEWEIGEYVCAENNQNYDELFEN